MEKEERKEHESYGVIRISRINGSSENLFGSSIKHRNLIELEILPACLVRRMNSDWIFPESIPYIKVQMSSTQFAEAITTLNHGAGTPVTIKSIRSGGYKTLGEPPIEDKRMQMDMEFKGYMKDITGRLEGDLKEINALIEKLPKKYQKEVKDKIDTLFRKIDSTLPFMKQQFTEQMDKTVLEAKGEVESFILHKVQTLGEKALQSFDGIMQIEDDKNHEQI